ncbi:MAG: hypothetical protein WAM69_09130, partial [Candidatus Sulfotelmatobacter sp.]
ARSERTVIARSIWQIYKLQPPIKSRTKWTESHQSTIFQRPASGVQWGNAAPVYFGGAVVDVAPEVTQNLSALR